MGSDAEQMVARYVRRRSGLYRLLHAPRLFIHNRRERLLPAAEGVKLFMGGAGGEVLPGFINVDVQSFPGVDVVSDVQALPFGCGTIAAIECDAVLEHVADPERAVSEMVRVLRPGGFLHVIVPFCHPFHGYPSDYHRWTVTGLRELFASQGCEVIDAGIRTGPTATLLAMMCEYAKLVGGKVGYALAAWILWPLRYLDVWLNRKANAYVLGNHLYALVQKK
ncbi:MAG TPA: methyltransferase domain-containing protein [Terriglobales bacterium]|nr:methyltransferase domain-containing protein [Terriglobales bacterium]